MNDGCVGYKELCKSHSRARRAISREENPSYPSSATGGTRHYPVTKCAEPVTPAGERLTPELERVRDDLARSIAEFVRRRQSPSTRRPLSTPVVEERGRGRQRTDSASGHEFDAVDATSPNCGGHSSGVRSRLFIRSPQDLVGGRVHMHAQLFGLVLPPVVRNEVRGVLFSYASARTYPVSAVVENFAGLSAGVATAVTASDVTHRDAPCARAPRGHA